MAGTLVVVHCETGRLDDVTRELVTAAAALGGPVTLAVIAGDPAAIAGAGIAGVDRLVGIRLPDAEAGHTEWQRAVAGLLDASGATAVLMPLSADLAAVAAGLAEAGDLGFASDVIGLQRDDEGAVVVTRPAYGGKAQIRLQLAAAVPAVLLLRSGVWPAAVDAESTPPLELMEAGLAAHPRIRRLRSMERTTGEDPLEQANVIFAIGRGIATPESVATWAAVARGLGASLGASRPVVDIGLLPSHHLVGQSGATVTPKLYIALGISGALQHLAGIRGSGAIVAVNTDRDAPIFDVARIGACVDATELGRQLQSMLPSQRRP